MVKRKTPARRRKAKRVLAVAGTVALIGSVLEIASGGVTLAERVLGLVEKGRQVLAPSADAATPTLCKSSKK
jgi:hypothetical protein